MTMRMVKLVDCIALTKGKPPAELPYFGDGAEPYLSPEYLRGRGNAEPAKPVANSVRVKDGDTVLLWDGSNAGEFFRGRQGLLASTMTHIGHGEEFEPEYFCYAAKRWEAYLKGQTSGSGIPHVDKEVLGKLEILKLPPDEQRLVAQILAKLDHAIEQTEALIAKQQRIKTGLMQDLLTKGIDEHGNIRSEATHTFKDSPLGRIPVEWDVAPLRLYISFLSYGFTNPMPEALDGPYLVTAANVKNGRIDYDGCRRTDRIAFNTLLTAKSRPRIGDVLITKDGTLGRVAVVDRADVCINQSVAVIRFRESFSSGFGTLLLSSTIYQDLILADAGGSTIKHIYISKLDKLPIAAPKDVAEQTKILGLVTEQAQNIERGHQILAKLHRTKSGLMHDLLTGERRVTALLAPAATQ